MVESPSLAPLSVAARTVLYPCLAMAGRGLAPAWFGGPAAPIADSGSDHLLLIDEPFSDGHLQFLHRRRDERRRTVVAPWAMSKAEVLSLLPDLDPAFTRVALREDWSDQRLEPFAFPLPVLAADPALDLLCRSRFGRGWNASGTCPMASDRQRVMCFIGGPDDLVDIAQALRAIAADRQLELLVVSARPLDMAQTARGLRLDAVAVDEADPAWLDALPRCRAALVSGRLDAETQSASAAVWALSALRAGVPVVTQANPLLDDVAGCLVTSDWERGLSLYLNDTWFRPLDAALGQARVRGLLSVGRATAAWREALDLWRTPARRVRAHEQGSSELTLMVLLDLAQDLDVCLPILLAVRRQGRFRLRIVVTDWLEREAPRTFELLKEAGFEPEVVRRKHAISHTLPNFKGVDALLVPSATSQPPHRAGYGLTQVANDHGVVTFTLQHGFENVGLTYRDEPGSLEVRFASRCIFTWGAKEKLPAWVSIDTLDRVVGVGNPKTTPPPSDASLQDMIGLVGGPWSRRIGVFENLHWHRYSEAYIQDFLDCLAAAAERRPDVLFLVKPHSAGRWLSKNPERAPQRPNILVIDPLNPDWRRFTAPDLIQHLDAVITTPSTVAVDGARAARPSAVVGDGGPSMEIYSPLPILEGLDDWLAFIGSLTEHERCIERNESFLRRNFLPHGAEWRIAKLMWEITREALPALEPASA